LKQVSDLMWSRNCYYCPHKKNTINFCVIVTTIKVNVEVRLSLSEKIKYTQSPNSHYRHKRMRNENKTNEENSWIP